MTIRIPDVSSFQGNVDWVQVLRSGRAGGICKATEGTGYTCRTFAHNWAALGALHAVRGAYHFARPGDPVAQAHYFLSVVGSVGPLDLLVLDIEAPEMKGDLSGFALAFLDTVQAVSHLTPVLYSYAPYIRAHLQSGQLARYPLWLAAYQPNPPACPSPWSKYILWQHTDIASISGIQGHCDESLGDLPIPAPPPPIQVVKPMYDPPLPIAAVWQDPVTHAALAGVTPAGCVYNWGSKWYGNTAGKPYWGNRIAAAIGPRPDGLEGYQITDTAGENYNLPDGIDQL